MKVLSVNIGNREKLSQIGGGSVTSGINKKPVQDAIDVDELGLRDDAICNRKHHGGPDQAIYLYRQEDYDFWTDELGHAVEPGTFGENLTLQGLPTPGLAVGDEIVLPDLRLQVAAPRIPCNTLASRMNDKLFAKKFAKAQRPGIYCRVLTPGTVTTDDVFIVNDFVGDRIDTVQFFNDKLRKLPAAEIKRYLAIPIDIRSRVTWEKQLSKSA